MSDAAQEPAKAPWHLWAVGIIALLWNAMGAMDYVMTHTRNEAYMEQFTEEQLEWFNAYPGVMVAFWAIAVWGGVLAAILLLLRKALAVPVFLISFVSMVVTTIYSYGIADGFEVTGTVGAVFSGVIFVLALLFYLYSQGMKRRGVLR